MSARDVFLYVSSVLIWGTTWLAITFQLGSVPVEVSVAYRFGLASALLVAYCLWCRFPLQFSPKQHGFMALQGFFLFGLNYVLTYHAERFISSGLTAVGFTAIVFLNILGTRIFFGNPISLPVLSGAVLGALGIVLVFWRDLVAIDPSRNVMLGLGLILGAAAVSSIGNLLSAWNQRRGLPIVQSNAIGMAYGALFVSALALLRGEEFRIEPTVSYLLSLVYLSLFGTVLAFGAYLSLLGRIGADKAAYASVLFPLVALGLSTWVEGFVWHLSTVLGLCLSLIGNFVLLKKRRRPV
ncbi:MAG: DMT family transporter [Vicinamibacteria bacterium]